MGDIVPPSSEVGGWGRGGAVDWIAAVTSPGPVLAIQSEIMTGGDEERGCSRGPRAHIH